MDRRHGTLPPQRPAGPIDARQNRPGPVEIGTYYRCLKNGTHTVIVERDPEIPSRRRH